MARNKAFNYLKDVLDGKINVPQYVFLQCLQMKDIYEGKNKKYKINENTVALISDLLKLMIMPKGTAQGLTIFESMVGFQWFFIISTLCTVHKKNENKRKFQKAVLEICRKNSKTFLVAVIFLLLFLLEPRFSKFYSVAPDGSLSREIKEMIKEIVKVSPALRDRFKIRRDDIYCLLTDNQLFPLNYSSSRLDGKLPSAFVVDEVGALPNNYAIEAMESGQLTIRNRIGFVISTKYPKINNPFEDEVSYAKKVLDGLVEDELIFSVLYEPDNKKDWETDNNIIEQSNPLALEIPEIMEDILKKRNRAIEIPSARENFVTKHCNIIYQGVGTETYIDVAKVQNGRILEGEFDWKGKEVFIGIDLAMTTDNCSVCMVAIEGGIVYSRTVAFFPEGLQEKKSRHEKLDYAEFVRRKEAFACGDEVVDYTVIEGYILELQERYGVIIKQIGYDRYNCISTAQKLEEAGHTTVEVKQISSVLHRPTKWLEELVLNGLFKYEENTLLEINFQNAKCTYDSNLNRFVNKKKSAGKVDMVISNLIALTLLQIDQETMSWTIQVI